MIQRFNKSSPWSVGTLEIIAQFVSGNILFLEQSDLDVSQFEWNQQLIKIKALVEKQCIQKILIDSTMNPEIVDKIYNVDSKRPSRLQIIDDLNQICNTYYITGDYSYHYSPDLHIKFFPTFLWTLSVQKIDYFFDKSKFSKQELIRTKTQYDTGLTKTKGIMCLNRNLTWHRLYLLLLLKEQSWFEKITYSFLNNIGNRLDAIAVKQFLTDQEREKIKALDSQLPIKLESELTIESDKIPVMWMDGASSVGLPEYHDHAINLVTETSLTEGIILTEKTCKPFMAYQIPVIVGPVGTNKFLQDIGLDMFEDIVPWRTWDDEADQKLKMQKIVIWLSQLLSRTDSHQCILDIHQRLHPRLIKNKEYFHSQQFINQLTQQLSSI